MLPVLAPISHHHNKFLTTNNLFQLFIGLEAVEIISFLLFRWWYGQTNTAALQAILYNCIRDVGFIIAIAWLLFNKNTWDFQQIFIANYKNLDIPLIGLLLAATRKSAQFGLHPFLPSATEGPTPVSALLNTSRIVVAVVLLLIRFHPIIEHNKIIQTATLWLGATTTLFTAICTLTQNDIKKIVAFSTSSQLRLIIVATGINQPYVASLHICAHAFFKAILFVCSRSISHSLNDQQDVQKIDLFKALPFTTTSLITGSLALTGIPFLRSLLQRPNYQNCQHIIYQRLSPTNNSHCHIHSNCLQHSNYILCITRTTPLQPHYHNQRE